MERNKTIELCILGALLIAAAYFWTLPFQQNQMPFGDVDSSTHFTLADSMRESGKPLVTLPAQFNNTYYLNTNGKKLWYFPQYHTGAALFQLFSGNRIVGAYLFFAIMSLMICVTSFVLIRELFGLWAAGISSLWLLFNNRDITWYILGVYPQVASFALVPLFLYCAYKYLISRVKDEPQPKYAIVGGILLVLQIFTHPQAVFISGLTAAIFAIFVIAKHKKLPIGWKEVGITLIIMAILIVPFISFFTTEEAGKAGFKASELSSLVKWYGTPLTGMGPDYYSFEKTHGLVLMPLAIVGVILLLLRRKDEDMLMLSWLIAFYISVHMSIIGLERSLRFMEVEAHILVPIAVAGVLRLPGLFKLNSNVKNIARIVLAIALVGVVITSSAMPAYGFLKDAFSGPQRITSQQYALTQWIEQNTKPTDSFYLLGTFSLAKKKWMRVLSLRQMDFNSRDEFTVPDAAYNDTYVIFDYSDALIWNYYGALPNLQALQASEVQAFNQSTIAYAKDNIQVYHVTN